MKKITIFLLTVCMTILCSFPAYAVETKSRYDMTDLFYPVGSYYETSDADFKPADVWGGTWELETQGRVHVSAGSGYDVGSTGGYTDSIVPSHTHSIPSIGGSTGYVSADHSHNTPFRDIHSTGGSRQYYAYNYGQADSIANWGTSGISANHTHGFTLGASTSGDASGNATLSNANMQPYINVYKWKRTS